jgi:hypothetical protein
MKDWPLERVAGFGWPDPWTTGIGNPAMVPAHLRPRG